MGRTAVIRGTPDSVPAYGCHDRCAWRRALDGPWHDRSAGRATCADTLFAMRVEVHFHAELARLAPERRGVLTLDVPEGTRVADLLGRFSLGPQRRIIVGLNGEAARLEQELVEGARIDLVTPMAGGSPGRSHVWRTATGIAYSTSI
jgi:sulfur carrier protein ThiS